MPWQGSIMLKRGSTHSRLPRAHKGAIHGDAPNRGEKKRLTKK